MYTRNMRYGGSDMAAGPPLGPTSQEQRARMHGLGIEPLPYMLSATRRELTLKQLRRQIPEVKLAYLWVRLVYVAQRGRRLRRLLGHGMAYLKRWSSLQKVTPSHLLAYRIN